MANRHRSARSASKLNQMEQAIRHFERAIALDQDDAESRYWIGFIRLKLGEIEAAKAAYTEAAQIRPQVRRQGDQDAPDFRLLVLYAPSAATRRSNTSSGTRPTTSTRWLVPSPRAQHRVARRYRCRHQSDFGCRPGRSDAIGGGESGRKLGKPIVNDPGKVRRTTRDAVADLLSGSPPAGLPKMLRLDAGSEVSAAALAALLPFAFPFWLGPPAPMAATISKKSRASMTRALSRAAYRRRSIRDRICRLRSGDGHFRKYRFIFVGEADPALPSGDRKRLEGASPLDRDGPSALDAAGGSGVPRRSRRGVRSRAFPGAARDRERIGLDYFGIDCAINSAAIWSSSRSMPRCWCTTTTRNIPTRIRSSAPSRPPRCRCCESRASRVPAGAGFGLLLNDAANSG